MELSTVDNGACTECEVLSEDCGSQMLSRHAFWKICPSNVTLAMATVEVPPKFLLDKLWLLA
jgi:hypothetical protein